MFRVYTCLCCRELLLMMAESSKRSKASRGLFSNYRYLCRKSLMLCCLESARARKKYQQKMLTANMKRKGTHRHGEPLGTNTLVEKMKPSREMEEGEAAASLTAGFCKPGRCEPPAALRDRWEVDSGFCSEASPPASGRSSPCLSSACRAAVVALDCEMVGTGPGGRCSELGRCSVLDYQGNVLFDRYVRPRRPVTDYRTRWSGIRREHLLNATPFSDARREILRLLEGAVVVGHSVYNDFAVLEAEHPAHLVRDTCSSHLLSRLAGFPAPRRASLKTLSRTLLDRKIQVGRRGHCSVEDALASLDLYKLVEDEWERQLQDGPGDATATATPPGASERYMQDEYWPDDVTADSQ